MIEYIRVITDEEQKRLEHDLVNIVTWLNGMVDGKINNCSKRAAKAYDELAKIENLETVPTQESKKIEELFKHPSYKNRVQRDADESVPS